MFKRPAPVYHLPEDYEEVYHLSILDTEKVLWLNVMSIALVIPFVLGVIAWEDIVQSLRGAYDVQTQIPSLLLIVLVIAVLPFHEWLHGIAIRWAGHRPRYGMKGVRLGPVTIPYVLFATADGVYFPRNPFIIIALTPMVVITLLGMAAMWFLPDYMAGMIGLAIIINGAGAVGDVWMTAVALRYPPDQTLVEDQEDSIRVYVQA
jgi:hypothetical protein